MPLYLNLFVFNASKTTSPVPEKTIEVLEEVGAETQKEEPLFDAETIAFSEFATSGNGNAEAALALESQARAVTRHHCPLEIQEPSLTPRFATTRWRTSLKQWESIATRLLSTMCVHHPTSA